MYCTKKFYILIIIRCFTSIKNGLNSKFYVKFISFSELCVLEVRAAHRVRFLYCFVLFVFILCLVPDVACISWLSILENPFVYL
jgi:hypothetical protein